MSQQLDAPVIFIIFNRPEPTRRVFDSIAEAKPKKLLLIADGPRVARADEADRCNEARAVTAKIDWPCSVARNFSDANLGCQERVISGLTWAFEQVEEAIILEDDCLPDISFFRFCQEMLSHFRLDSRIGMISGNNFTENYQTPQYSYHFSRFAHIWGWATWRTAWQRYDRNLSSWDAVRRGGILQSIFPQALAQNHWSRIFQSMHDHTGPDTWDYQWYYTMLTNNMLSVVPSTNLVHNIGFGADATHTKNAQPTWAGLPAGRTSFPLTHPPYIVPCKRLDDLDQEITGIPTIRRRLKAKINSAFGRLRPQGPANRSAPTL